MQKAIREKSVPQCVEETCDGLVKPEIVFFGEQLPAEFFANRNLPAEADLCIIMGTSLTVHPFAALPQFCSDGTPRVLINQDQVGGIGSRPDDVLMLGDCDTGVRKLAEACGWLEELESLWAKTAPERQLKTEKEKAKKSRDEQLQEEVERLTKEVEEGLKLGEAQHNWLKNDQEKLAHQKEFKKEQHKWLDDHLGDKLACHQEMENGDSPTQPGTTTEAAPETTLQTAPTKADSKTDSGGGGLGHVFPFLNKKPSL